MGSMIERVEHGRGGGKAGAEGEARRAALEIGNAALEGHPGRVLRARVFVAFVDARTLLGIGRGRIDRHHDGAGGRVRRLASMDAAGVEGELVLADPVLGAHRARIRK
jgi:hypothetical protein